MHMSVLLLIDVSLEHFASPGLVCISTLLYFISCLVTNTEYACRLVVHVASSTTVVTLELIQIVSSSLT